MNDNEIRVGILDMAKKVYDENPHNFVQREKILEESKITPAELDRNIKYLEEKGLIDVQWFIGGSYLLKINSYGIDEIERIQLEIQRSQEEPEEIKPEEVIPILIDETKLFVDSKLKVINLEILTKLNFIYEDMLNRDHPHSFASMAYSCREILMDFTDALFKEDDLEDNQKKPTRNQTKNKIKITLKALTKSETHSGLLSERFEYVISYLDLLSDYIQKNAHPDGFEVTSEDAKCCLIYTYLFMRDILKILETK